MLWLFATEVLVDWLFATLVEVDWLFATEVLVDSLSLTNDSDSLTTFEFVSEYEVLSARISSIARFLLSLS